jgi:hypothetical protein
MLTAEKGFGLVAGHLGCECYPRADTPTMVNPEWLRSA